MTLTNDHDPYHDLDFNLVLPVLFLFNLLVTKSELSYS